MTLTMPRAGMSGGRSADIRIEAPQTGAAIQALGQVVQQVGTEVERRRLDSAGSRLDVDMTRDINALRLEFEEYGDPDRIDAEWGPRVQALKQTYLTGQTDTGRPRVDPKLAERFTNQFDALTDRHAFALGSRALAQRQSQSMADYIDWTQEAINTGSRLDLDSQDALLAMGERMLDERVASGALSPEQAAQERQRLRGEMRETTAMRLIRDDPQMFLDLSEGGEFDDLPADQRERFNTSAQTTLTKAADTAERERVRIVGEDLSRIAAIDDPSRLTQRDRDWLASPAAQDHPDYARSAAAVSLADESAGWKTTPPEDLRAMIAAERATPVAHAWQEERLQLLEAQLDAHEKGLRQDPVAYLAAQGFAVPDLPPFDPGDPQGLAQGLARRAALADQASEFGWSTNGALLTEAERTMLSDQAKVTADPVARLSLASSIVAGLGDDAVAQASALSKGDPVFTHATRLMVEGAPQGTLSDMMAGARAQADGAVVIPADGEFANAFRRATDDMLADHPGYTAQLRAATAAIYAASSPVPGRRDEPRDFDQDQFDQAFQRALGGQLDPRGRQVAGGIAEVRGEPVPLPVGIRADLLETQLDGIAEDLIRQASRDGTGPVSLSPVNTDRLTAASLTGAAPYLPSATEGDVGRTNIVDFPVSDRSAADLFREYHIVPYWPDGTPSDSYAFVRQRGGRAVTMPDENGDPFVFSLRRLMEAR